MPRDLHRLDGGLHLFDGHASFHSVQNLLRAALAANPQPKASQLRQQIGRFGVQTIGSRNAFEGNMQAALSHLSGVGAQPPVMNGEHIVGNPHHVRLIMVQQPFDFVDDTSWLYASDESFQRPDGCTNGSGTGQPLAVMNESDPFPCAPRQVST